MPDHYDEEKKKKKKKAPRHKDGRKKKSAQILNPNTKKQLEEIGVLIPKED